MKRRPLPTLQWRDFPEHRFRDNEGGDFPELRLCVGDGEAGADRLAAELISLGKIDAARAGLRMTGAEVEV